MNGRELVVGVTGGIAAYKTAALVSQLVQAGAGVSVVMTESAAEFIGAATFEALTGRRVYSLVFHEAEHPLGSHIALAQRGELLVVAPATANFLAKAAAGAADDLLSTLVLSFSGPLIVAPAMNCQMWEKPAVRRNVEQLRRDGAVIVDPEEGWLSCRTSGVGRMASPETIRAAVEMQLASLPPRKPQHEDAMARILITSGPTRQYLDPVRYLTNASSGRMGRALAESALAAGHQVVVVSGPVEIAYPRAAEVISVVSTEDMLEACQRLFPGCNGMIGVAAPCDYRPIKVATGKINKTGEPLQLQLIETPDVVATLGASKQGQWLVGFALETDDHRLRALAKLEKKSCDLMVLNGPQAMNALDTQVEIIDPAGSVVEALSGTKERVAQDIFRVIQQRLIRR